MTGVGISERQRLDAQTRRWLKQEVSRRRKAKHFHVGRPVLHRYSEHGDSGAVEHSLDATAFFDEVGPPETPQSPRARRDEAREEINSE